MSKPFDSVLKELRRLGKSAADLADSLEAMEEAGEEAAPVSVPQVHAPLAPEQGIAEAAVPPDAAADASALADLQRERDRLLELLSCLMDASAECVMRGDGFGSAAYRILPPTEKALRQLDETRTYIREQLEEAGLA